MARRRYFRYYPRRTVAKKKWASNLITQNFQTITQNPAILTLVENKAQASAPTPTIIKTGNFKVQGDVYLTTGSQSGTLYCRIFIIYVPEGFTSAVDQTFITNHPEWIMGWTFVDTPGASTSVVEGNKFSITSRLKRNLNSGDKIVLAVVTETTSGANVQGNILAQFWTCAN